MMITDELFLIALHCIALHRVIFFLQFMSYSMWLRGIHSEVLYLISWKLLNYSGFQSFDNIWAYLKKVIPTNCVACIILDLYVFLTIILNNSFCVSFLQLVQEIDIYISPRLQDIKCILYITYSLLHPVWILNFKS